MMAHALSRCGSHRADAARSLVCEARDCAHLRHRANSAAFAKRGRPPGTEGTKSPATIHAMASSSGIRAMSQARQSLDSVAQPSAATLRALFLPPHHTHLPTGSRQPVRANRFGNWVVTTGSTSEFASIRPEGFAKRCTVSSRPGRALASPCLRLSPALRR